MENKDKAFFAGFALAIVGIFICAETLPHGATLGIGLMITGVIWMYKE